MLITAFGSNDKDWIDQKIELYAGTIPYNGVDNAAVLVRALSSVPPAARTKPEPQRDDPDDEVPY
jgi:hypothetical protein